MKVCVNAGHCPNVDSGAVGKRSQEAVVTRDLMKRVSTYLEKAGCEVLQVQKVVLPVVCNMSNEWEADIFVSIHCNAANKRARGTETFAYRGSVEGRKLASCIQKQLLDSIDTIDRGVKEAGFYVLKHTNCPAALVEVAFIDNEEDENILLTKKDEIARAIARGVTDYIVRK